jgi:hypothetical protein
MNQNPTFPDPRDRERKVVQSFTYNKSEPEDYVKYVSVGDALRAAAEVIIDNAPDCADRTTALRCLRESRMWANAAINLKGLI